MTTVWLVGITNAEEWDVQYVCSTKEKALKRWDEVRKSIIRQYSGFLDHEEKYIPDSFLRIVQRCLINLKETDPEKMDNYPQDQPHIVEMEVE